MVYLFAIVLILYVLTCLALVGFILTQEGKGGGLSGVMGASMGETFGFGGATSTIRRFTAIAATIFLILSVGLTFLGERVVGGVSSALFEDAAVPATTVPAPTEGVPAPATTGGVPAPATTTDAPPAASTNPGTPISIPATTPAE